MKNHLLNAVNVEWSLGGVGLHAVSTKSPPPSTNCVQCCQMTEKVLLAYSGGLDTSCILAWLLEQVNARVEFTHVQVELRSHRLHGRHWPGGGFWKCQSEGVVDWSEQSFYWGNFGGLYVWRAPSDFHMFLGVESACFWIYATYTSPPLYPVGSTHHLPTHHNISITASELHVWEFVSSRHLHRPTDHRQTPGFPNQCQWFESARSKLH